MMIVKNIIRIFKSYKFFLIQLIFFEIIFRIRGYKGNTFHFSTNNTMADDIPCPYYFLFKINKIIKQYNFHTFIDLGCGSGRTIYFFNENFPEKKFIGIEYYSDQYEYCKKIFKKKNNITISKEDFTNYNFINYGGNCYFFNNPFKNDEDIISVIKKITNNNLLKENILFIFVNFNRKVIEKIDKIKCLKNYYINNNKGFSVHILKEGENNE